MLAKRVTIKDVAERAGVSKSTVSHVINDTRHVEATTKQRVTAAIDELGYRPSSIARSLVSKRTKTAGLLVTDVGNPFYPEVIQGAEEIALENGYQLFLCNCSYDPARGLRVVHSLIEKEVDGVLCLSSSLSAELIQALTKNKIPVVMLGKALAGSADFTSTISINFKPGISEAIAHLVDLEHRHIAHIGGLESHWTAQERRDLFKRSLQENGLQAEDAVILAGNLQISGGRKALLALMAMEPRPSAVFCFNDLTALGVIWEARNQGIRIPNELSVVGLDDIELGSVVSPPLTTVALPRYEIGVLAMQTLLETLERVDGGGQDAADRRKIIDTKLVIRESTAYFQGKTR